MGPFVEITFDCLPLRSLGRLDTPLDASAEYRARQEKLAAAMEAYGPDRTYFLYNAKCVFHLANSEIEGMIRYRFEGCVRTDAGDAITEQVDLEVQLVSDTCDGIPALTNEWLIGRVKKAVAVEFDRFIAAGTLAQRATDLGKIELLSDVAGISGMHV